MARNPRDPFRTVPIAILLTFAAAAHAMDDFERPPIEYSAATPDNAISDLQTRLKQGDVQLEFEPGRGYLPSLLRALNVPAASQTLVFSKTSLQRHRISPRRPRAIYFNDEVYVGFCQSGEVLEVSVADPKLGTVFYTLDQDETDRPAFVRQTDNCLLCHSSSRTGGIPGHVVRSLFVDASGQPIFSAGSQTVDHTTPIEKRWGGWYVTGTHGKQAHSGNLIVGENQKPYEIDNSAGQNLTDLNGLVKLDGYLSPHSDIVALMVLEHQTLVHNRLTQANFTTRQALDYEAMLNRALHEPPGKRLDSTTRRIAAAGDALIEALLLVDEAELTATVSGTSGYADWFSQQGPRDRHGRSLREFDLTRRLFKHPCSYLIYARSFDELPSEMRDYVWQRLWNILSGADASGKFAHLSDDDRQAIQEILHDTKTNLPDYWKK
jgi:hypothetical protein